MQIEPLNLSHQSLLKTKFQQLNLLISEYSFANLYLFRHLHNYHVLTIEKETFIKGMTRDQLPFIMLTTHPQEISLTIWKKLFLQAQLLFPIPEDWLPIFQSYLLQCNFKEEDSDYLFSKEKLAFFPGRRLSGKRNLLKQFLTNYEVRVEDLKYHLSEALKILESWQLKHLAEETDYSACQEALKNFEILQLQGRIIYANQQAVGFIIGEPLSSQSYAIHFSKAEKSMKGLYQFLYQDLAQNIKNSFQWINLEQDLGISNLKKTKNSYEPDQMIRKWRIKLHS